MVSNTRNAMTDGIEDPTAAAAVAEAKKIALQLVKEGGRGAILLGAARLDLGLENLLKKVMHPHVGGDDNLFGSDRPLGTFSAKIVLAARLGLIEKSVEHALQVIRRVRNDFAHSFEDASLADQTHRNRLTKPYADARRHPFWQILEPILAKQPRVHKDLREYICLVVTLVALLEFSAHQQQLLIPARQVRIAQ